MNFDIVNIPSEIWIHIFKYLQVVDLARVSKVCRVFYDIAYNSQTLEFFSVVKSSIKDNDLTEICKEY